MTREHAKYIRNILMQAAQSLPDETAAEVPEFFMSWNYDSDYVVGDRRRYNDLLWKCVQAHHSQPNWTPDVAVSLWARASAEEWPEWIQPTGAQNAYNIGDKVTYNGIHYTSNVDSNVWAPDVYGWAIAEE